MVSLSRSANTNEGGATFFSEPQNMDDRELLQPILEAFGIFKPLKTIPLFCLHLLATLALLILGIVYTVMQRDDYCRQYFVLIYIHVGLWFFTLVIDQIVRIQHYNLRMNGYLDFYKKTQVHHRLPLYIVSLSLAFISLIQALMQHIYGDSFIDKCIKGGFLSPIGYLCALVAIELSVIMGVNLHYMIRVRKFNIQKPPPDVQKEEWNACSSVDSFAQGEIGYRQRGDKVYDFIEKQADLIRHLKDHNAKLGEKLMILNAQLQNRHRPPTTS